MPAPDPALSELLTRAIAACGPDVELERDVAEATGAPADGCTQTVDGARAWLRRAEPRAVLIHATDRTASPGGDWSAAVLLEDGEHGGFGENGGLAVLCAGLVTLLGRRYPTEP